MHIGEQIVFFDGVCGLCNHFVDFLLRHDRRRVLIFSPLQGKTILQTKAVVWKDRGSVVLLQGDRIYTKSTAILESLALLGKGWMVFRFFLFVPACLRDYIYDVVAKHRYAWFGKKDSCRFPTAEEKARFLE